MENIYDLVIIGTGPAGLSASVYASRYGLRHIVVGEVPGGLISSTNDIGNWLGEEKMSGYEFATRAMKHVQSYGAEIKFAKVATVVKDREIFKTELASGEIINTKTILLATGTDHRHLDVTGEKEFAGKGVSYCATCDGFFYKDKIAAVVGGGNTALVDAVYLGNIAQKVYVIHRGSDFTAESHWKEQIFNNKKIEVIYNANITEIRGGESVTEISLDKEINGSNVLKVDGIFVAIGFAPQNELARQLEIDLEDDGHVKVNEAQKTSISGVWAAGDITNASNKFKQMLTAASEGAVAVHSIFKELHGK